MVNYKFKEETLTRSPGALTIILVLLLFSIYVRAIYLRGFKGATKKPIVEQMSFK